MAKRKVNRISGEWWSGSWEFILTVEQRNGSVVIAGLHIGPIGSDGGHNLPDAPVPEGGITSEVLRGFKIQQAIANTIGVSAMTRPELVKDFGPVVRIPAERRRKPGRPSLSPIAYARAAVEYEERGRVSRTPVKDMADDYVLSVARMRDMLNRAREKGYLTAGTPGRAGGRATAKARRLIERQKARTRLPRGSGKGKGR